MPILQDRYQNFANTVSLEQHKSNQKLLFTQVKLILNFLQSKINAYSSDPTSNQTIFKSNRSTHPSPPKSKRHSNTNFILIHQMPSPRRGTKRYCSSFYRLRLPPTSGYLLWLNNLMVFARTWWNCRVCCWYEEGEGVLVNKGWGDSQVGSDRRFGWRFSILEWN